MDILGQIARDAGKSAARRKKDAEYRRLVDGLLENSEKTRRLAPVPKGNSIIAEVKFASPSGGVIAKGGVPAVVSDYEAGGAAALSILTEEHYFKGSLENLIQARNASELPILRKDFILDEFQLEEARAFGADGVLLIAGLLGEKLAGMLDAASSLGLWVLVETRSKAEIKLALDSGAKIIGINNRDLKTMKTDLKTTIELCTHVPASKALVTESGLSNAADIQKLKTECKRKPDYYLIGTALMKDADRKKKLKELVNA
ncbi:MAG: indole-3-glycerol-phosphate synthase [Candidatus Altiarchaeota archaeon]|nr:indole-3-glycerol-phosphate synthase [Candidatus Altiarchaeota archaeon]